MVKIRNSHLSRATGIRNSHLSRVTAECLLLIDDLKTNAKDDKATVNAWYIINKLENICKIASKEDIKWLEEELEQAKLDLDTNRRRETYYREKYETDKILSIQEKKEKNFLETQKKGEIKMEQKTNEVLLAELDDTVQRLAKLNNEEWAKLQNEDKKQFEQVKKELYKRLDNVPER